MTFIDITDRQAANEAVRASEARFRMLFDFIDEGFCTLEKVETKGGEPIDFRYLTANPGFESQSGMQNVVGQTIREVFPGEAQEWFDIYDKVWTTGDSMRFERELVTQGRTLELFAFRFDDGLGLKLGVIFIDISDRKRHDEQQELLLREMDHRSRICLRLPAGLCP